MKPKTASKHFAGRLRNIDTNKSASFDPQLHKDGKLALVKFGWKLTNPLKTPSPPEPILPAPPGEGETWARSSKPLYRRFRRKQRLVARQDQIWKERRETARLKRIDTKQKNRKGYALKVEQVKRHSKRTERRRKYERMMEISRM